MKTESIKVNDIEMDYFSFGTGKRSFVILPGAAVRSTMYSAMAIQSAYGIFAGDYTVYVLDRRKNMPDSYSVRQMAADTAEVMRALGVRDADIFGASQGGMIAMCIAIDNPGLAHKIALGSTAAYADDEVMAVMEGWLRSAQRGDIEALTAGMIEKLFSRNTIDRYENVLVHMNDGATGDDIRRFIIQVKSINGFNIADELQQIKCPAFVVGVEGDKVLHVGHSRFIAEKLGCPLYIYGSEYGHCVFDEAPDYKRRLMDFFRSDEIL